LENWDSHPGEDEKPATVVGKVGSWQQAVGSKKMVFSIRYSVFSIPCLTDCISRQAGVSAN